MLYRLFNKVIYIGIIFLITFSQVNSFSWEINSDNSNQENNKIEGIEKIDLVITGFYSPLPNQKRYVTGSYEKEIALNGDWVWMASWKRVYTWALAAPKKYSFWTKIYIEWYWVWVVEDRWGSIIDAEHTRIDIWMWYGDEWLERAIKLWSRKAVWYITKEDAEVTFSFWEPKWEAYVSNNDYKYLALTPESSLDDVKEVQDFFKGLLYYYGEVDWKYESIKPLIIRYQLQKWIVLSKDDEAAWYIWPKTIASLNKDFWTSGIKTNLSKIEKNKILNQVLKIQNKLWDRYKLKAEKLLEKIKVLKKKETLNTKTKIQLEYLEIIL